MTDQIVHRTPLSPPLPGLHPVVETVYRNRGVTADELNLSLACLPSPWLLPRIESAVDRIRHAIEHGERIVIAGDYDADGATATAVAVLGLRKLGGNPAYKVPDRFRHGYGLTPALVDEIASIGADLIITVDAGISSHTGIERAREHGIDVVVTDHHLLPETLPEAAAIVNPKLDENNPFCNLAGVGVIFYILCALRARMQWDGNKPTLGDLLDLVALGTVADVVPLDYVNRILVRGGMNLIRRGRARPGIRALLSVAGREPELLAASDFGFGIGPRLNAAGRLENMATGIECLLAGNEREALRLAQILDDMNRRRREIQADIEEDIRYSMPQGRYGLCYVDDQWHEGVVGIVASKVKELANRPVFVFTRAEDGSLKGSGRSIPGFHLRDALVEIDAQYPGIILKFGGHAAAAGLSIRADAFDHFEDAFEVVCQRHLESRDLNTKTVEVDGSLPENTMTLETARALLDSEPYGQVFPEPVFLDTFEIRDMKVLKEAHLKMRLRHQDGNKVVSAIWFHADLDCDFSAGQTITVAYRVSVNRWNGEDSLQLMVMGVY